MEIDKDGNIKANGEAITKLLVDGKLFYGGDPKIASQNLPADAIQAVEVIDEKSDKVLDTGIDDGKRTTVLNLVVKPDKKRGWFGNAALARGSSERYLGSMSANQFNKDKQVNVLLLSNNVNQSGFTYEDISNFNENEGDGLAQGSTSAGLVKTMSGAINHANSWGKKKQADITTSYVVYHNNSTQRSSSAIQSIQPDQVYFNQNGVDNSARSLTQRFNFTLDDKIDEATTLRFKPFVSLSTSRGKVLSNISQVNASREDVNTGFSFSNRKTVTPQFNGSSSLSHTFTSGWVAYVSLDVNMSTNNATTINQTNNQYYLLNTSQVFDRREEQALDDNYIRFESTLSKSIGKSKSTSIFYNPQVARYTNGLSSEAMEYNPATGLHEIGIDSLASATERASFYFMNILGINTRLRNWNLYATATFRKTTMTAKGHYNTFTQDFSKDFYNIASTISATYSTPTGKRFALNFEKYVKTPRVNQFDLNQYNTDPLNIRLGNPGLKQEMQYLTQVNYRTSNPQKRTYFLVSGSMTLSQNSIATNTSFDPLTGIQVSKPVNIQGNHNFSTNMSFTIPVPVKGLTVSPTLSGFKTRTMGYLNSTINKSDNWNGGGGLTISYA